MAMASSHDAARIYERSLLLSFRECKRMLENESGLGFSVVPREVWRNNFGTAKRETIVDLTRAEVTEMLPIEEEVWHQVCTSVREKSKELRQLFGVRIDEKNGLRGKRYLEIRGNHNGVEQALLAYGHLLALPKVQAIGHVACDELFCGSIPKLTAPPGLQSQLTGDGSSKVDNNMCHQAMQEAGVEGSRPPRDALQVTRDEEDHCSILSGGPAMEQIDVWKKAVAATITKESATLAWVCPNCKTNNTSESKICDKCSLSGPRVQGHKKHRKKPKSVAVQNATVEFANPLPLAGKTLPPPRILVAGLVANGIGNKNSASAGRFMPHSIERLRKQTDVDVDDPDLACYLWDSSLKRPRAQRRGGC